MALLAALGIVATLADALWLIVAWAGRIHLRFLRRAFAASAPGSTSAPVARPGLGTHLSSCHLGGSLLGTPAGWTWSHGGWPGVIATLLACAGLVIAIAVRLRRLAGD